MTVLLGPWDVTISDEDTFTYTIRTCRSPNDDDEYDMALLIAAVPDLLFVCRRVLAHLDGSTGEIDAVDELRAVIAKAAGR